MRRIELNGVVLCVCTKDEAERQGWGTTVEWGPLVTTTPLSKQDMVRLLGLRESVVDYALPQEWARENPRLVCQSVWYYGFDCTFGGPYNVAYAVTRRLGSTVLELALAARNE